MKKAVDVKVGDMIAVYHTVYGGGDLRREVGRVSAVRIADVTILGHPVPAVVMDYGPGWTRMFGVEDAVEIEEGE